MNCRMTRGIYLRANGEINCYCSTGEQISLVKLPLDGCNYNFVTDYYYKNKFKNIRDSIINEKLPFREYCLKCHYLDPFEKFDANKVNTEIEWVHIEATAICNLKCPFCIHGIPKKERKYSRPDPKLLPVGLYNKIIEDISSNGMNIKWMYFSGRGEPGLHPDLWRMVDIAKNKLDTNFLVNTNGNIVYDDMIVDSGLDKIKIAFDSHNQKIYSHYRINGRVNRLLKLTRMIAERKIAAKVKTPEIIWQRLMFNFNDSDEELIEYQKLAMDYGVNTLWIIYSWTDNRTLRTIDSFPKKFPNIKFIDYAEWANISMEVLNAELEKSTSENTIASYLSVIRLIMNWLKYGTVNRDRYDEFANLPISDKRIFDNIQNNPYVDDIKQAIKRSIYELSKLYKQRNEDAEHLFYLNLYRKI